MSEKIDLSELAVLPNLPDFFRPDESNPFPPDLKGATIEAIGTCPRAGTLSGGGLIIDYRAPGEKMGRRIVFEFNDVSMWVSYRGHRATSAIRA